MRLGYLFPGTLPARALVIPSLKVTAPIRKLSLYNCHVLSWVLVSITSPLSALRAVMVPIITSPEILQHVLWFLYTLPILL